jgi:hypothetical protein
LLRHSVFDRHLLATGQNERAANLAGVEVGRVRLQAYVLCGTLAALTGFLLTGFTGGAALNMGDTHLMESIAVVVLGGERGRRSSQRSGHLGRSPVFQSYGDDAEHISSRGRGSALAHGCSHHSHREYRAARAHELKLVYRLLNPLSFVAFKMGRLRGGRSRAGAEGAYLAHSTRRRLS